MGNLYNEHSIEHLSPLEFTRLRPGVYAGDCTYSTQLLIEIFSNAVDEYNAGHGNVIDVTIEKDVVTVTDYGQGFICNHFNEDGTTILEAAFSLLNTSGKYREDGSYEGTSLGSFGIGSKITTYLSHWLKVRTWRDSQYEFITFKEGVFEKRTSGKESKGSGTEVTWQPSEEFFTHTEVEISKIKNLFKTISCLCPGLTINLNANGEKIVYNSKNGLHDLVDEATKDNEIINKRLSINCTEDKYRLNLVMTYTSNYSSIIIPYVNTGLTDSGSHITQLKTTLTREMNKFFREKGWLKEKDENLTGDDIQEGLYLIFNYTAPSVAYDAQVKSRITNINTKPETAAFTAGLLDWLQANEKEIKVLADKAINARKAREAAKKARDAARDTEKKKKEKVVKVDGKLADCYSKDRLKCEIYITEGDSASGSLKTARNNEFQAVMPVRGKILNTQKATLAQIQKNAEIVTMIDAFGLEVVTDPKSLVMRLAYDPKKLRYGKIIIMSDADIDGAHIKNLFYTFIWNFCPQLLIDGYVYAGVPPLYRVTMGKDYIYLKNDEALEEFKRTHVGKKYLVNRMKGLGEMSVEEVDQTLMDPNNRIIKQITVEDAKKASALFEQLMGQSVVGRKVFIKEHAQEAGQYNAE